MADRSFLYVEVPKKHLAEFTNVVHGIKGTVEECLAVWEEVQEFEHHYAIGSPGMKNGGEKEITQAAIWALPFVGYYEGALGAYGAQRFYSSPLESRLYLHWCGPGGEGWLIQEEFTDEKIEETLRYSRMEFQLRAQIHKGEV